MAIYDRQPRGEPGPMAVALVALALSSCQTAGGDAVFTNLSDPSVAQARTATTSPTEIIGPPPIVFGNPDAPVRIVLYGAPSCPFTARFFAQYLPVLEKEYLDPGKAVIVCRHLNRNDSDFQWTTAIECVPDQTTRPTFVREAISKRYKNKKYMDDLVGMSRKYGVDVARYDRCWKNPLLVEWLSMQRREAVQTYGVTQTPTAFVNGRRMMDPSLDALRGAIDAELALGKQTAGLDQSRVRRTGN